MLRRKGRGAVRTVFPRGKNRFAVRIETAQLGSGEDKPYPYLQISVAAWRHYACGPRRGDHGTLVRWAKIFLRMGCRRRAGSKSCPYLPWRGNGSTFIFPGKAPAFTPPLSMEGISPFRKRVWEIMLEIPFGQTSTYGKIAERLEKETGKPVSAQAVGGAVGHNSISLIIPCHRVIGDKRQPHGLCRRCG